MNIKNLKVPRIATAAILISGLLLSTTVAVKADAFIYSWNGTNYAMVERVRTPDSETAIVCNSSGCMINVTCSACHTMAVAQKPFTRTVTEQHFQRYYQKIEIPLAEGATTKFGALTLRRVRGILHITNPQTRQTLPLPSSARLLKGKNGEPWIHYSGAALPPFSR